MLSAGDLKIFLTIKSTEDSKPLQFGIKSTQKWNKENYMKINSCNTNFTHFNLKSKSVHLN